MNAVDEPSVRGRNGSCVVNRMLLASYLAMLSSGVFAGRLIAIDQSTGPVTVATMPTAQSALRSWERIRALPAGRIDDTLGFMIDESAEMARIASAIEKLNEPTGVASTHSELTLARLRCLYFAAAIDGDAQGLLNDFIDAILDSDAAPPVRAEAAHRRLIAELSRYAPEREWSAALSQREIDCLASFLACNGASPRAFSAIKRLTEHANRRTRESDLRACRNWASVSVNHHPFARAIDGDRRRLGAIGSVWAPPLTTFRGTAVDWSQYRGKPAVIVFAGGGQSPSNWLLARLREALASSNSPAFRLVVVTVRLHQSAVASDNADDQRDPAAIVLDRGWRDPVLTEFGVRALPTVFLLDEVGRLERIIQPSDWRTGEKVLEAIAALNLRDESGASVPTPRSTNTEPTTNRAVE